MKDKKKFARKLALNKETIAKLDQEKVHGGGTVGCTDVYCPYNPIFQETDIKCTIVSLCPCS